MCHCVPPKVFSVSSPGAGEVLEMLVSLSCSPLDLQHAQLQYTFGVTRGVN